MKKTAIASLKERLTGWTSWDIAAYQVGACLGFWPEFGAPPGHDPWHGIKNIICETCPLSGMLYAFLQSLAKEGCLESHEEPDIKYRWNPNYKGAADIISTL